MKKCSKCGMQKPAAMFGPERRSADKLRYSCKECDRKIRKEYHAKNREKRNAKARELRAKNPEIDRQYQRRYRDKFVWRRIMQHARKRAAKFGWKFDLDRNLKEFKHRVSQMTCELTGVTLVTGAGAGSQGKRLWNTASLDRIDPRKGYTIKNVRIVCWAVNCAMGTWGKDVLIDISRRLLEREK